MPRTVTRAAVAVAVRVRINRIAYHPRAVQQAGQRREFGEQPGALNRKRAQGRG